MINVTNTAVFTCAWDTPSYAFFACIVVQPLTLQTWRTTCRVVGTCNATWIAHWTLFRLHVCKLTLGAVWKTLTEFVWHNGHVFAWCTCCIGCARLTWLVTSFAAAFWKVMFWRTNTTLFADDETVITLQAGTGNVWTLITVLGARHTLVINYVLIWFTRKTFGRA